MSSSDLSYPYICARTVSVICVKLFPGKIIEDNLKEPSEDYAVDVVRHLKHNTGEPIF